MRRILLVMVVCLPLASSCDSGFRSEREEHQYLSSLSNPTPGQWKRRQELERKFEKETEEYRQRAERQDAEERARQAAEWNQPANVEARRQAAIREREARIAAHKAEAKAREDANGFRGAIDEYEAIIRENPDGPEAEEARDQIKRLEGRIREMLAK